MPTVRTRAVGTRLIPTPPAPGTNEPPGEYVMVELKGIDSAAQAAIPFDDPDTAPAAGQLVDLVATVVPGLAQAPLIAGNTFKPQTAT